MPDSEAKKNWIKENTIIFSVKLMKRTEDDIISFLNSNLQKGIGRNATIKLALREYIENHKEEEK